MLIEGQVLQPSRPERLGVKQDAGSLGEGLSVPGPPETLIPLGAIRGTDTKWSRCDQTTFS